MIRHLSSLSCLLLLAAVFLQPSAISAQTDAMFIDANGRVGVGTNTPAVPLHVVKTTAGNANMFRVDNNGAASFEFRNTANSAFWFFQADQDGTFKVSRLGTGGSELIVRNRGDVGGPTLFVDGSVQATNVIFTSSRAAKTDFAPVDRGSILSSLLALPLESWRYKTEDPAVRHIGPTAEDFSSAFGLGSSDSVVSVVDVYGIAIAGVQALHEELTIRDTQIAELQAQLAELRAMVLSSVASP